MSDKEPSIKQTIAEAEAAEAASDDSKAIELYKSVIKMDALNANAYTRLMKIFRQRKEYKKELGIIDNGIKVFEKFHKSELKARSKKVSELSDKLNRSFGLTDKQGNSTYDPEPIATWKKRKINVEKKVK